MTRAEDKPMSEGLPERIWISTVRSEVAPNDLFGCYTATESNAGGAPEYVPAACITELEVTVKELTAKHERLLAKLARAKGAIEYSIGLIETVSREYCGPMQAQVIDGCNKKIAALKDLE